ncbi:MAG: Fur family transcriptional regulator [Terriglobales bacterium]
MFCDAVIRDATRPGRRAEADAPSSPLMAHAFDRRSLLDELRAKHVRLTAQRRAVVEVMQQANEHLDVNELLERARARGANVDRATVYRTIELLKRHRLIDELDLMHMQGEKHYYEARTRGDHVHLACLGCGRILECATPLLDWLKLELATRTGFDLRVTRLEVGGYCASCRAARARSASSTAPEPARTLHA